MENGTGSECQQSQENVRVFIRVRPLSKKELSEGNENIVLCDHRENLIALRKNGEHTKPFKFDHIFGLETTQLEMYKMTAFPIVEKVLEGYNGTIFAYGQTGTGKTYTMVGKHLVPELKGIVPNTFSHIFSQISRASEEKSFVVKATYLEIYNEEVRDLLAQNPTKKLAIRERKDIGVYVKDLMGFTVDSIQAVTELINRGNKNRITRSTLMNDVSSRSHAIFTVTIESKNRRDNKTTVGKLNLVDLAGSERASRTQATGERLKEASNINLSLSVLGNVISALVDGKSTHIPYRNSKLTRLLQDSLGGNSKTAMIAMISPADIDYEESMCTLRYASRVKFIKNCVKINVEEKGLIEGFELEIAELKERLTQLNLLEQRKEKRKDDRVVSAEEKERFKQTRMELEKTEKMKNELEEKVALIQKKILVGGENLLEKAQQQAFFLESSAAELENLDRSHQQLEEQLNKKTLEKIDVEEQYSSLQEEDVGLTKKLKKIQMFIKEAKEEHSDKEREYQRDLESLYDNNRLLVRETQLANLIIDSYIPPEYLSNMIWSNDGQEYQMRGVAYTGNNMRKRQNASAETLTQVRFDMKQPYHKYPERKKEKPRDKRQLPKSLSAAPKSRAPIFFYTGNEGEIENFAQNTGFMFDIAPEFNALLVFAEHRYYGESLPFGNESFSNIEKLGYLSSQQALADFVYLIDHLQDEYINSRSFKTLPVITFGGSYGGMLSAWIRMRYPGSVLGSIASSAPIWQFNGLTPCENFNRIASTVYSSSGTVHCTDTIKKIWATIRSVAKTPAGKTNLSTIWQLCTPISTDKDIKTLIDWVVDILINMAMANYPYPNSFLVDLPAYPVLEFCRKLNDKTWQDDVGLLRAFGESLQIYTNYTGHTKCNNIIESSSKLGYNGWLFQSCTDMIMPICSTDLDMFENEAWDFQKYSDDCYEQFKIRPRDLDVPIREYGGKNIEAASNIIFSNGLLDPWSGGGVLRNINDDVRAVIIPDGAHHYDLRGRNDLDTGGVKDVRNYHVHKIKEWIRKYYNRPEVKIIYT